ncbi:TPA: recombinase family protein [Escherichia coli]|nr:recombinase family protein [Escherichia coli]
MTAEEKSVLSLFMIGVLIVVGKVLAGGEPITPRLFIGRMLLGGFVSMVAGVVLVQFEELRERGVNFRSLTDAIDTSTPMGRFFFHVMGALAEMERELIVERTRAGLEAARAKGRIGGRRPKLTASEWEQAGRLLAAGESRQRVALIFDIGLSTLYKKFPSSATKNKLCHPLANRDK